MRCRSYATDSDPLLEVEAYAVAERGLLRCVNAASTQRRFGNISSVATTRCNALNVRAHTPHKANIANSNIVKIRFVRLDGI
jgi:hypothetical protein